MKKLLLTVLVGLLIFALAGCGGDITDDATTDEAAKIDVTTMTAGDIMMQFQDAGFPLGEIVVYTEDTDTNSLLGRPDQYTSKASFSDSRIEQPEASIEGEDAVMIGGTVEVFENADDATARKEYIESVTSGMSVLVQYMYQYENVLIRIDGDLTPTQAAQYEAGLNGLAAGEAPIFSE